MKTKFCVLCLSFSLVFSIFSQVSCQDETPSGLSADQHFIDAASEIQTGTGQNNSTATDTKNTNSLSFSNDNSPQPGDVKTDEEDSSVPSQSHAELHAAIAKKMEESINQDYEASVARNEKLKTDESTQDLIYEVSATDSAAIGFGRKKITIEYEEEDYNLEEEDYNLEDIIKSVLLRLNKTTEPDSKLRDINESFPFLFNKTSDGVCGCFNREGGVLNETNGCSVKFEETNAELSATLTQLIEIYRETEFFGYEFRFNATKESIKSMEKLKITLMKLVANLSVRQLLIHPKFDLIADFIMHLDVFNSTEYTDQSFASLIKYRETILEGFQADKQIEESEFKANILKEIAIEKERIYDVKYNETKYFAEVVDQLKMRILTINRLLMKLEKDSMEAKNVYTSLQRRLMVFLSESSRAKEEYVVAARKVKEQIASGRFAIKETRNAEITWAQLQRSFFSN